MKKMDSKTFSKLISKRLSKLNKDQLIILYLTIKFYLNERGIDIEELS